MRQALAPLLFDDEHPQEAAAGQDSPVAPAERSASARRKATTRRNDQDQPVHSFQSLLKDLATITRNTLKFNNLDEGRFVRTTTPTDVQRRALNLLGVSLTPTEECSRQAQRRFLRNTSLLQGLCKLLGRNFRRIPRRPPCTGWAERRETQCCRRAPRAQSQ